VHPALECHGLQQLITFEMASGLDGKGQVKDRKFKDLECQKVAGELFRVICGS